MWVSRVTSGEDRWVRSPRPVRVTGKTVWPALRRSGTTFLFQAQEPPQAPGTITNVAMGFLPSLVEAVATGTVLPGRAKGKLMEKPSYPNPNAVQIVCDFLTASVSEPDPGD